MGAFIVEESDSQDEAVIHRMASAFSRALKTDVLVHTCKASSINIILGMARPATLITLSETERAQLEHWLRQPKTQTR
ncbi:MAG TPA: hypothetical protein VGO59_19735, partial [Verrucomicrobiae bacterium]